MQLQAANRGAKRTKRTRIHMCDRFANLFFYQTQKKKHARQNDQERLNKRHVGKGKIRENYI